MIQRAFLQQNDETFVRLGSEIAFLSQAVEQMKKESDKREAEKIEEIKKLVIANEAKDKYIKQLELQIDRMKEAKGNEYGYEYKGQKVVDGARGGETESLPGQCRSMDDRSRPYSDGGATETEKRYDDLPSRSRRNFVA